MASIGAIDSGSPRLSLTEKLWSINWGLVLLLSVIREVLGCAAAEHHREDDRASHAVGSCKHRRIRVACNPRGLHARFRRCPICRLVV